MEALLTLGRICRLAGGKICTSCGSTCRLDNRRRNEKRAAHGRRSPAWFRLRAAVLERDGHRCVDCGAKAVSVHLDPRLRGDHTIATLADCMSVCARCHGKRDGPRAARRRR